MTNPTMINNPSHRNTIFDLFFFWGMVDKNYPTNLARNKTVDPEYLLRGFVKFFCDVGIADGGDEVYYTKWKYRVSIIECLNRMWEDNYFIDNTRKIRDTPEFSSFIGHIITD